jgi:CPA2 family monovalent cation:H+ antiporter-2
LQVVPGLILVPALVRPGDEIGLAIAAAVAKGAFVLGVVILVGPRLMRAWFGVVARGRSSELFMLNVLLITLGLAYVTGVAGLSLALGAFLAGMLISETEYRYRVEEDIKPFRDVLLGLFFVTVGMLLDLRVVISQWWLVLGPVRSAGRRQACVDRGAVARVRQRARDGIAHGDRARAGR